MQKPCPLAQERAWARRGEAKAHYVVKARRGDFVRQPTLEAAKRAKQRYFERSYRCTTTFCYHIHIQGDPRPDMKKEAQIELDECIMRTEIKLLRKSLRGGEGTFSPSPLKVQHGYWSE